MRSTALLPTIAAAALALAACGTESADEPAPTTLAPTSAPAADPDGSPDAGTDDEEPVEGIQRYPDVIDATAERVGETWTVSATLSSPYDTPERYADAWRVLGPDGTVYGERILAHDHANEQPFTRSQSGIEIPDDVGEVVIEGRDLRYGYGGATFTLVLPADR